jgi:hypothetical protein
MPEGIATWESEAAELSSAPPVAEATPTAEPEVPASAEIPSLEKPEAVPAPDLEVQPAATPAAVREEESVVQPETPEKPKEEEWVADPADPPEIAAQNTNAQRKWAKRQYEEAGVARKFHDLNRPITEFTEDLYSRSQSRYWELVKDLTAYHADYVAKELFGATVDEVKAKLTQPTPSGKPAPVTTPVNGQLTTEQLEQMTNEQILEHVQQAQAAAAKAREDEIRAEFDGKLGEMQTQFESVNSKLTTQEQQQHQAQVNQIEADITTRVFKVVEDVVRDSGLEAKSDDPPKIAALKKAGRELILTRFEPTFDADEDNVKVVERVREYAKRLERHNVDREEDNLKVRARSAAEKIRQSEEVKAILEQIEATAQSKAPSRLGSPVVSVPGAPAGVAPPEIRGWDDAKDAIAAAPLF